MKVVSVNGVSLRQMLLRKRGQTREEGSCLRMATRLRRYVLHLVHHGCIPGIIVSLHHSHLCRLGRAHLYVRNIRRRARPAGWTRSATRRRMGAMEARLDTAEHRLRRPGRKSHNIIEQYNSLKVTYIM